MWKLFRSGNVVNTKVFQTESVSSVVNQNTSMWTWVFYWMTIFYLCWYFG